MKYQTDTKLALLRTLIQIEMADGDGKMLPVDGHNHIGGGRGSGVKSGAPSVTAEVKDATVSAAANPGGVKCIIKGCSFLADYPPYCGNHERRYGRRRRVSAENQECGM